MEDKEVREKVVNYVLGQYMIPVDLLDDIMQRLYIKAHEYLTGKEKKPIAYLAQCLRNEIKTALNEEKKQISIKERYEGAPPIRKVETPFDFYVKKEMKYKLLKAICTLSLFERMIICKRFGYGLDEPHTLQELANEWGKTPAGIKYIVDKALNKIKKRYGNILEDYLE